jgi:hypothetical protein
MAIVNKGAAALAFAIAVSAFASPSLAQGTAT